MFETFNQVHDGFLFVAIFLAAITVVSTKFLGSDCNWFYGKAIGILLISHQIYFHCMHIWILHTYTVQKCLPLHLCSLSVFVVAIALITDSQRMINAALVWSPAAAMLGLLFPALENAPWNSFSVLEFFWSHILVLVGVLYLALQENFNLSLKKIPVYCSSLIILSLAFVYPLNRLLDANYMYLQKLAEPGPMSAFPAPPGQIPVFMLLFLILSTIQYCFYISLRRLLKIESVQVL